MRRTLMLIMVLLAVSSGWGWGAPIGLNDVVRTLEEPFQSDSQPVIRDFAGDFFQESRIASLDRVQRGRGEVWVKFEENRPGLVPVAKFRWEYRQPTSQEIVSDGETMWVYLPENRQVIQSEVDFANRADQENPMTFLTGLGNLSRDFRIGWASPNIDVEGNFVLELVPRRVSSLIRRLLIVVDRDAVTQRSQGGEPLFPILSTTVEDPNGNLTLIEFNDIRVNRNPSDAFFNFILPAGVEVVRPTGSGMGF